MTIVTRMLALAGLGLLLGAADSWIRPVQLRLTPPSAQPAPATHAATTTGPATAPAPGQPTRAAVDEGIEQEITVAQAKRLHDAGVMFIDARLDEDFAAGHIQGALHLTATMFSEAVPPKALQLLDPAAAVVIYCSGGDCEASHDVGIRLQQAGFQRLHIMVDGFPAWKGAGYAIETGTDPLTASGG